MGVAGGHLDVEKVEVENASILRLYLLVVLPGEQTVVELTAEGRCCVVANLLREVAAVGEIIVMHASNTSVDVKECATGPMELRASDSVALDSNACPSQLAIKLHNACFVLSCRVCDNLYVEVVTEGILVKGSYQSCLVEAAGYLLNDVWVDAIWILQTEQSSLRVLKVMRRVVAVDIVCKGPHEWLCPVTVTRESILRDRRVHTTVDVEGASL